MLKSDIPRKRVVGQRTIISNCLQRICPIFSVLTEYARHTFADEEIVRITQFYNMENVRIKNYHVVPCSTVFDHDVLCTTHYAASWKVFDSRFTSYILNTGTRKMSEIMSNIFLHTNNGFTENVRKVVAQTCMRECAKMTSFL